DSRRGCAEPDPRPRQRLDRCAQLVGQLVRHAERRRDAEHRRPDQQRRLRGAPVARRRLFGEDLAGRRGARRRTAGRGALSAELSVAGSMIGNAGGQIGDEALNDMLGYIGANADVWLGWTWWAGGPWWGEDMFTLEPQTLGQPNEA